MKHAYSYNEQKSEVHCDARSRVLCPAPHEALGTEMRWSGSYSLVLGWWKWACTAHDAPPSAQTQDQILIWLPGTCWAHWLACIMCAWCNSHSMWNIYKSLVLYIYMCVCVCVCVRACVRARVHVWVRVRVHVRVCVRVRLRVCVRVCDPLCENPAKVIFCDLLFSTKKNILHVVKNILWNVSLCICNIDWVRSCQRLKL